MSDLNVLIEQMVSDLSAQTFQLEDQHLRLFLNWLMDHSSEMKVSLEAFEPGSGDADMQERFRLALRTWLRSLPPQGLLWEYRIITEEIGWWHALDPFHLKMMVRSEVEQ